MDYDFLRYIGVKPEIQRQVQSHYLPLFEKSRRVLDLACGDGDFVTLLCEAGIEATGVDSDPKAVANAQNQCGSIVEADVFDYLRGTPVDAFDGIFCAHLVEHLPYPQVIKLIRESYRVLEPGGIIVLATPNVRGLVSHLEMFYMHYGHVSFYHPKLLCFFLEHENFVDAEEGVNPKTGSHLMAELAQMHFKPQQQIQVPREVLSDLYYYHRHGSDAPNGLLRKMIRSVKDAVAYVFVRPYLDRVAANTHQALVQIHQELARIQSQDMHALAHDLLQIRSALGGLNGPFECYAMARKPRA